MIDRNSFLADHATDAMLAHALAAYPEEAVGVILTSGQYEPMENLADDPARFATMNRNRMAELMMSGELKAVFHSHPDGPNCPSKADMMLQQQMDVPFILVSTNGHACTPVSMWGDTLEPLPLEGRGFQHGISDCYSAIRDWWRINKNVLLPEFPRSWDWWEGDDDLYMRGFPAAGFRPMNEEEIGEPMPGDVILFTVRASTHNHGGVYVGNGLMYHHATGRKPWDAMRLAKRDSVARWAAYQPLWLRRDEDSEALRGAGQQVRRLP